MRGFCPRAHQTRVERYLPAETNPSPGTHLSMRSGLSHKGRGDPSIRYLAHLTQRDQFFAGAAGAGAGAACVTALASALVVGSSLNGLSSSWSTSSRNWGILAWMEALACSGPRA